MFSCHFGSRYIIADAEMRCLRALLPLLIDDDDMMPLCHYDDMPPLFIMLQALPLI